VTGVRGLERVQLHADQTILAKLSCALASGASRAPSGMAPGTVALQLLPGYRNGGPERPRREGVAESHSHTRRWGTIAAFVLIIAVNIGEGIDMGFDFWNWLLIAIGAAAILQAVYRLPT